METLTLQEELKKANKHIKKQEKRLKDMQHELESVRKQKDHWIAIAGKRLKIIENAQKALKL